MKFKIRSFSTFQFLGSEVKNNFHFFKDPCKRVERYFHSVDLIRYTSKIQIFPYSGLLKGDRDILSGKEK